MLTSLKKNRRQKKKVGGGFKDRFGQGIVK